MRRAILVVVSVMGLCGCTSTAGPFVTNIQPVGPGRLAIQRCEVTYSRWSNAISMDEDTCTSTVLTLPMPQPVLIQPVQPQPVSQQP